MGIGRISALARRRRTMDAVDRCDPGNLSPSGLFSRWMLRGYCTLSLPQAGGERVVVAVDDDDHSCKLRASALACLLGIFMFSAITDLKTFRAKKLTSDIVCHILSYSLCFPWNYCLTDKSPPSAQGNEAGCLQYRQCLGDADVLEEI